MTGDLCRPVPYGTGLVRRTRDRMTLGWVDGKRMIETKRKWMSEVPTVLDTSLIEDEEGEELMNGMKEGYGEEEEEEEEEDDDDPFLFQGSSTLGLTQQLHALDQQSHALELSKDEMFDIQDELNDLKYKLERRKRRKEMFGDEEVGGVEQSRDLDELEDLELEEQLRRLQKATEEMKFESLNVVQIQRELGQVKAMWEGMEGSAKPR
eukprot:TRINITY_DN2129_c1_g1_i1.p1 TRINITY_DN2129_c1_g1~~TRINITY_DN2129_c1_g1_i1.p1  ORF type:complete len:208 (-),score=72.00 TRINITY_DN2129_c1_g1_i1:527-1150(-)